MAGFRVAVGRQREKEGHSGIGTPFGVSRFLPASAPVERKKHISENGLLVFCQKSVLVSLAVRASQNGRPFLLGGGEGSEQQRPYWTDCFSMPCVSPCAFLNGCGILCPNAAMPDGKRCKMSLGLEPSRWAGSLYVCGIMKVGRNAAAFLGTLPINAG